MTMCKPLLIVCAAVCIALLIMTNVPTVEGCGLMTHKGDIDCAQPPVRGPCKNDLFRFYYNSKVNRCRLFFYGGCGGNTNNFKSQRDCRQTCAGEKDKCKTDRDCPKNKQCTNISKSWIKNMKCMKYPIILPDECKTDRDCPKDNQCKKTWMNNMKCRRNKYPIILPGGGRISFTDECKTDPDCPKDKKCKKTWKNNMKCRRIEYPIIPYVDICTQPPVAGPCLALMPRFYYDQKQGRCTSFNYGGCRGNGNNFGSMRDCQQKCGKESASLDRVVTAITSGSCDTKSWPSVVGESFEEAKATILLDCPGLNVYRMLPGSGWTLDLRSHRVRVATDAGGVVVQTPNIA